MRPLSEKQREAISGALLVVLSLIFLMISMESAQRLDDANKEHERECDIEYRSIIGNFTNPNPDNCDSLLEAKSNRTLQFIASLSVFLVAGLAGLATLLTPGND